MQFQRLCLKAAEAGISEAKDFFSMTPREIFLLLSARRAHFQRREREKIRFLHALALAVHAPEKLPPVPPCLPLPEMTDDEIRRRLFACAERNPSNDT